MRTNPATPRTCATRTTRNRAPSTASRSATASRPAIISLPILIAIAASGQALANGTGASSFATSVTSYNAGTGANPAFTDASTALGAPERFTGEGVFPSSVTPLNSPFGADEVVSIGLGGQLTLAFDHMVMDDPDNPFGIDLLIFGNSFFLIDSFSNPDPTIAGIASEGGRVEVSADGVHFVEVIGAEADGLFPTLGYADETAPFGGDPGLIETDFTRPVDPGLDPLGMTFSEVITAYDGSGGGLGIDLSSTGLAGIRFVRISTAIDADFIPEIDAIADVTAVPAPGALALLGLTALAGTARRRASVMPEFQAGTDAA